MRPVLLVLLPLLTCRTAGAVEDRSLSVGATVAATPCRISSGEGPVPQLAEDCSDQPAEQRLPPSLRQPQVVVARDGVTGGGAAGPDQDYPALVVIY